MIDFFIIGAQKCASTFIHNIISDHPGISMPSEEIPLFQDPDYTSGGYDNLIRTRRPIAESVIWGIKRPDYLAKSEVPKRIKKHCPNAKLIVVLRSPVERASAAYFHYMMNGFLPTLPIEVGMPKLLSGELDKEYPRSKEILEYGLYYKHVTNYLNYFNENQLTIIFLEDIKKKPIQTAQNLYRFLGVSPNYIPTKALTKRPQKVIYSVEAIRKIQFKNKLNFTYSEDKLRMHEKRAGRTGKVILLISNLVARLIARFYNSKEAPVLPQVITNKLTSFYADDIQKLARFTNRDLSQWLEVGPR